MALGDKVEELQKTVAEIRERLDNTAKLLDDVRRDLQQAVHRLFELQRNFEKEHALLKREVEEHGKWKDDQKKQGEERSRRLWAFGPNLLGAVISGIIAAVVAYFIARR